MVHNQPISSIFYFDFVSLDQNKLNTITGAALKCAASGRVVAFRPSALTASQQLASSLSEISVFFSFLHLLISFLMV